MNEKRFMQVLLPRTVKVMRLLPVPGLDGSAEGRAFSLAAELADGETSARSLQKLVCRHWRFAPLTLCGLALNLCEAIRQQRGPAVTAILDAMLEYIDAPAAA
jgi:hypothetical protein